MIKTRLTKEILDQIDKSINPERNLGRVTIKPPKVLRYTAQEEIDNPQGISFEFKKRYYYFFRGDVFALDKNLFGMFNGQFYYGTVKTNQGNFIDDGLEGNINIHYSVQLYCNKDRTVKIKVTSSRCSLAIYTNNTKSFSSEDHFLSIINKELSLVEGWNTLDLFYYRKDSDGYLKIEGDIGRYISAWRPVDFEPPTRPEWIDTNPVVSEYRESAKDGRMWNVLKWKKFPSSVLNVEDLYGWRVYKYYAVPLKDVNGNIVTITSGWGISGVALSGDFRQVLPIENTVYFPTKSNAYLISGTYFPHDDKTSETLLIISGSISPGISGGDSIFIDNSEVLFTKKYDPSLQFIVSGFDTSIQQGETYKYYIRAIDNSPNMNISLPSEDQSLLSGDFVAPNEVLNLTAVPGYRSITVTWDNPSDEDFNGCVIDLYDPSEGRSLEIDRIYGKKVSSYTVKYDLSDTALNPSIEYTITVKSFDYNNNISVGSSVDSYPGAIAYGQESYDDDADGFYLGKGSAYKLSMKYGTQKLTMSEEGIQVISGTITAGTFQTSTSGKRIAISGSDNTLRFFDSTGDNVAIIDDEWSQWGIYYDNIYWSGPIVGLKDGVFAGMAGTLLMLYDGQYMDFNIKRVAVLTNYGLQLWRGNNMDITDIIGYHHTASLTLSPKFEEGNYLCRYYLPYINTTAHADLVVNLGNQVISGTKTFASDTIFNDSITVTGSIILNSILIADSAACNNPYEHPNDAYDAACNNGKALILVGQWDLNGSPFVIDQVHSSVEFKNAIFINTGNRCDAIQLVGCNYSKVIGSLIISGTVSNDFDVGIVLSGSNYTTIGNGIIIRDTYKEGIKIYPVGSNYNKESYYYDILMERCGREGAHSSLLIYQADNLDFERIYSIDGGSSTHGDFYVVQSDGISMQKCRISSPARYGLEITSNTYSFRFQGDIGGAQQHGIVINGCRNVDVYDSLIHWNAKGGINTYDNIHITGATRRATVHDCMIFSTKEPNDYLTTYGHHGIYIDTLVSGSNIHDNIIFDHNTDGICLKGGFNNVHNNEIYHNASVGIDIISGATKNRISHNNVYNNDIDILNGGTSTRLADNYSDF